VCKQGIPLHVKGQLLVNPSPHGTTGDLPTHMNTSTLAHIRTHTRTCTHTNTHLAQGLAAALFLCANLKRSSKGDPNLPCKFKFVKLKPSKLKPCKLKLQRGWSIHNQAVAAARPPKPRPCSGRRWCCSVAAVHPTPPSQACSTPLKLP